MSWLDWLCLLFVGGLAMYGALKLFTDRDVHEKNAAIMWVLQRSKPDGMYALDICKVTGVGQSLIYPMLSKLEDRGLVRFTRDPQWPHRYRYHFIEDEARKQIAQMQGNQNG